MKENRVVCLQSSAPEEAPTPTDFQIQRIQKLLVMCREYGNSEAPTDTWLEARDAWAVLMDAVLEAGADPEERIIVPDSLNGLLANARHQLRIWTLRWENLRAPGEHLHPCPHCYEHAPCTFWCHIIEDLGIDNKTQLPLSSHALCDECIANNVKLE